MNLRSSDAFFKNYLAFTHRCKQMSSTSAQARAQERLISESQGPISMFISPMLFSITHSPLKRKNVARPRRGNLTGWWLVLVESLYPASILRSLPARRSRVSTHACLITRCFSNFYYFVCFPCSLKARQATFT